MKIRISCCPLRTAKGRYHIDGREQHTGRATVDAKRHEQTKELAITLPSLEESDGCTMVHVYSWLCIWLYIWLYVNGCIHLAIHLAIWLYIWLCSVALSTDQLIWPHL